PDSFQKKELHRKKRGDARAYFAAFLFFQYWGLLEVHKYTVIHLASILYVGIQELLHWVTIISLLSFLMAIMPRRVKKLMDKA
ncbi:hypothetical protein ACJX0J_018673, partial [Zea mays]